VTVRRVLIGAMTAVHPAGFPSRLAEQGYGFVGGACCLRPSARVDEARLRAGLAALDW
jgi:hypothetical protein